MNNVKIKNLLMKMILLLLAIQSPSFLMAQKTDSVKSGVYKWNKFQPQKEKESISRKILDGSTVDLANLEIHTSTLEPGKAPHPAHKHTGIDELIIVKQGKISVTVNGSNSILGPSGVAMIMAGDEHGVKNAGDDEAIYYILKFEAKSLTKEQYTKSAGASFAVNWDTISVKATDRGLHRNIFDQPTSQFVRFEMHATTLNAGQVSHAPHRHRAEEIILIIKGNVEEQIGNIFYKATAGDVLFLESETLHALKNVGNEACEYFAFQWEN